MNIYPTSICPYQCAEYLDDRRIPIAINHVCQIMVTALKLNNIKDYRLTKGVKCATRSHKWCTWAAENASNFRWLLRYFYAMCEEHRKRRGVEHVNRSMYRLFSDSLLLMPAGSLTEFVVVSDYLELNMIFNNLEPEVAYQLYLETLWRLDKNEPKWYGKKKAFYKCVS